MYVNIGDTALFYEVYGSKLDLSAGQPREKPTFLFLHGGAGFIDHTPYVPFWSRLSDVAEVVFIDQRGSGRSRCDNEGSWNLAQWGKDVYLFCQALGIKKPFVGGISYGGMVAMSYMLQYPDHPKGVVLTDTDARIDRCLTLNLIKEHLIKNNLPVEKGLSVSNRFFDGPLDQNVVDDYFKILTLFGEPVSVIDDFSLMAPTLVNLKLAEHFLSGELQSVDYREQLNGVQCPVLFLSGDQGPLHNLKTARELIASFPENKLQYEIFAGAKAACYESQPDRALQLLRQFLRNNTAIA